MTATLTENPRTRGLTPFQRGDPRASEAGKRGAEARRAQRLGRAHDIAQTVANLQHVATTFHRDQLGPMCAAAAADIVGRLVTGEIKVRHAGDAADILRVLVDVARLEAGQTTSNAAVMHVRPEQVAEHIGALQAQARSVLSATVLAAADNETDDVVGETPDVVEMKGETEIP